jgi:Uma2 family endonuclease
VATETNEIAVEDYLASSFDPDMEYVDGVLVERNVGEPDHSRSQFLIAEAFRRLEGTREVRVFVECRVFIADEPGRKRYRVPDVSLARLPIDRAKALMQPPLVVVEVLSPDDRLTEMLDRCQDYVLRGVAHIWVVDPEGKVFTVDSGGLHVVTGDLRIPELAATIRFDEIFRELRQT